MKKLILIGAALASMAAFAGSIKTAEYYVLNTWTGEYPAGYRVWKTVKVPAVRTPEDPADAGSCTLKPGMVIHPWAQKTKSEFVTLSGVTKFKAVKSFELFPAQGPKIQIQAGDMITELTYLAEGQCLLSVNGVEFDEICLDPSNGNVVEAQKSPFRVREFFKTTCKDGQSAWIDAEKMKTLVEDRDSGVIQAEVLEYGKVKEP